MRIKFKRILIAFLLVCMLIPMGAIFINMYITYSAKQYIIPESNASTFPADCILVLGAGVRDDGSPSPMLSDRLEVAVNLFKAGASNRIIMSGDHGSDNYDEVNAMKAFAVNAGVPSECIFMDHAGFSTYESLYRAKAIFCAKSIIVVTQKYHLYRALYIASSLDINAHGVSADLQNYSGQNIRDAREVLARVKDFFMCIIKPLPKYLGETMPVFGNGDDTNDKSSFS